MNNQAATTQQVRFRSVMGVGDIIAFVERYSEGTKFGVSWASTNVIDTDSLDSAVSIAMAVSRSDATNIHQMRIIAANLKSSPGLTASNQIDSLMNGAIGYTLDLAERQSSKGRPISSINRDSICLQFAIDNTAGHCGRQ